MGLAQFVLMSCPAVDRGRLPPSRAPRAWIRTAAPIPQVLAVYFPQRYPLPGRYSCGGGTGASQRAVVTWAFKDLGHDRAFMEKRLLEGDHELEISQIEKRLQVCKGQL
jgi:hypothetical protein